MLCQLSKMNFERRIYKKTQGISDIRKTPSENNKWQTRSLPFVVIIR